MLAWRKLRLQGAEKPILFRRPAGLDDLQKGGSEAHEGLPAIAGIGLAAHGARRFQRANRYAHRLRAHALGACKHRNRRRAVALQPKKNRFLRVGEISRMRLLPRPTNQFSNHDPQFTRKNGKRQRFGSGQSLKQLPVKHGSRDRYLIQVNLDERARIRLDLIDVLPLQSLAFSNNTACGLALDELDRNRRD